MDQDSPAGPSTLDIDFVVPCGRPNSYAAGATLRALAKYRPAGAKVIVVGPGLGGLRGRFPDDAFVWIETGALFWPAVNRNRGAAAATGRIIMFVDDDCLVDRAGITAALDRFSADPNLGALTGRAVSASDGYWAQVYDLALFGATRRGTPAWGTEHFACVVAARRSLHEQVGGFDETLRMGDDCDYAARILNHGHKTLYEPLLRIVHDHGRTRMGPILRHFFWCGRQALPYEWKRYRTPGLLGRDRIRLLLRPLHPFLVPVILLRLCLIQFKWNSDRPGYLLRRLPGLMLVIAAFEAGRFVEWWRGPPVTTKEPAPDRL